jgi:hypothetical protein
MRNHRTLRGTLFDIERELRTRNSGADENFSESKAHGSETHNILRRATRKVLENIGMEPKKNKEELKREIQSISKEVPEGGYTPIAGILDAGVYEDWKKKCMEDVEKRLKSRVKQIKSKSHRTDIAIPTEWFCRDFGFQQWMADGEMPNSYGFKLYVLEYYFTLSEKDKKEFNKASVKYKTAGAITWALDRFPSEQKGILSEAQQNRVNLINAVKKKMEKTNDEKREKIRIEFNDALKKGTAEDFLKRYKDKLSKFISNNNIQTLLENPNDNLIDLIGEFRILGHEMRKSISLKLRDKVRIKDLPHFAEKLKSILEELDKDYHLAFGDNKGNDYDKNLFRLTYAEIGRAWGDVTAAKGLHPWNLEEIKKSHSVLGEDYKKLEKEKIQGIIDEGTNSWCDMNASGGLWSLHSNLDRYRNTIVILHIPESQETTGNLTKDGGGLMAATFMELQMSYYTPIVYKGTLLRKYARMLSKSFERTNTGNSVHIGTYPKTEEYNE